MHSGLVYTISNFIIFAIMMASANFILEERIKQPWNFLLEYLTCIGYYYITTSFPLFSGLRPLFGFLYLVAVIQLFHKGSWWYKLIVVTAIFGGMALSEVILGTFFYTSEEYMSGQLFEEHAVSIYAIDIFITLIIETSAIAIFRKLQKKGEDSPVNMPWYLFAMFPLTQLAPVVTWIEVYPTNSNVLSPGRIVSFLLLCMAADASLFVAMQKVRKGTELETKNKLLNAQIHAQEQYYRHLTESYDNIRLLRHDINNHLYTIQTLIEDGKTDEAREYANNIQEYFDQKTAIGCRNAVVGSYLYKKGEDLEEENIQFESDIRLPRKLSIPDPELISLFSNLLDNAEEATLLSDDPKITLSAIYKEPYLTVFCSNTADKSAEVETSKKVRKAEGLNRGIGHIILENLAKKYDGLLESNSTPENYQVQVILKTDIEEE